QLEIRNLVDLAGSQPLERAARLVPVQEPRAAENRHQRFTDAGLEAAAAAAFVVEPQQRFEVGSVDRPAIRALREAGQYPFGAGAFGACVFRIADEDALAALGRAADAARIVRAENFHAVQPRD